MPRKLVLLGFHVYALYSQYKLAGKKVFSIYKSYYARGITWITSLIDYPVTSGFGDGVPACPVTWEIEGVPLHIFFIEIND